MIKTKIEIIIFNSKENNITNKIENNINKIEITIINNKENNIINKIENTKLKKIDNLIINKIENNINKIENKNNIENINLKTIIEMIDTIMIINKDKKNIIKKDKTK